MHESAYASVIMHFMAQMLYTPLPESGYFLVG